MQCMPALLLFARERLTPEDLVFGPRPGSKEQGQWGSAYAQQLQERLHVTYNFSCHAQANSGILQKRAYDTPCQGRDFASGDRVWVYLPLRKKGVSSKLTCHWEGPCRLLAKVSDVVYQIHTKTRG